MECGEEKKKRLLAKLVSAVGGLIAVIAAAGGITASQSGGFEGTVEGKMEDYASITTLGPGLNSKLAEF